VFELLGFHIVRELGRGGMATVYVAEQLSPAREVALKVLDPQLATDPAFTELYSSNGFLSRTGAMRSMRSVATGLLFGAAAAPAIAGTITVNGLGDNGPGNCSSSCTLRDAIAGDTIEFGIFLPWTITLNGTAFTRPPGIF
jgi:CSLREA domain-containing protein